MLSPENADLTVEPVDRTPHVRLAEQHRSIVDHVAGGEVVGSVDDQVVLAEQLHNIVVVQPDVVHDDLDIRIGLGDGLLG